ncbi:MAG: restriction endonuclease subunit S [Lachnospiraceae bacterium]|nr:restriction endonuclease subunit S [Lachnospiraceae bacterium]
MRKKLKEVCDFYSGTGFPVKYQGEEAGELPFYKVGDIANNATTGNVYLRICNNYISNDVAKEIKGTIIPADVVVFAKIGEALKLNRRAITSCDCLIDNNAMGIGGKREYLNSMYFYFYMKNLKMETLAESTTVPSVRKTKLEEIEIEIPTLNEQGEIVDILAKLQSIISERQGQLEKLDELIKARFVELFGNPVRNEKGWITYKLEECLDRIDNGKSFVCSDKARTGVNPAVLKLSAATYGNYRPDENKALLDDDLFVEGAEVQKGDLLFTRKNTPELVGMAAYVHETPPRLMMPDLIFRLVPNEKMNAVFLWQLINCREFRPVIQSVSGGSAKSMSNISKERLGKISIICPPRELQDELVPFIEQVDKSKFAA